ncbi:hypothetical protein DPMN_093497 [Dreissena polymorpha]|uniref:Uncharacterized protein n=1 Tax=Dreissena polymorpha TaxID=45954 RepID=A0A9D4L402_DREPO|nr:hypothetical protein DPMN_093497 [Dreissena polymorpha]
MEELSQYNIILKHRPGRKHVNADTLSRPPMPDKVCSHYVMGAKRFAMLQSPLPLLQDCHYCKKAHSNWARFTEEVDEAVPLGVDMQRLRIAGGGSTKINWDKEDSTRVNRTRVFQRNPSVDRRHPM